MSGSLRFDLFGGIYFVLHLFMVRRLFYIWTYDLVCCCACLRLLIVLDLGFVGCILWICGGCFWLVVHLLGWDLWVVFVLDLVCLDIRVPQGWSGLKLVYFGFVNVWFWCFSGFVWVCVL